MPRDMEVETPTASSTIPLNGENFSLRVLGIIAYTPSRVYVIAKLSSYAFDPKKKQIIQRTQNKIKLSTRLDIVINRKIPVLTSTDKAP